MVRSRFIIVGLLLLAFVGSAWAGECRLFAPSDRTKCIDFSIQTRYVGEADFSGVGASTLSVEDDLGWGFNLGYSFTERINVGCFFAWRTVAYSAHIDRPDLDHTYDFSGWMDTANTGVNVTLNILKTRFTPYLQGAVSWAMVDTNIPVVPDIDCWVDPWWGYICIEDGETIGDDAASYALGAGLSWQMTDEFFVRAGYEKNWIDVDAADDFDIVRVDFGYLYR